MPLYPIPEHGCHETNVSRHTHDSSNNRYQTKTHCSFIVTASLRNYSIMFLQNEGGFPAREIAYAVRSIMQQCGTCVQQYDEDSITEAAEAPSSS